MPAHADEFQALSDSLYHWSVYEPAVKCEIGCVALRLESGFVVVDPVPLVEAAWKDLLALAPLRAILLTNGNHVRDTVALRKQHHVPIVTGADARRDVTELRPDITLLPNELTLRHHRHRHPRRDTGRDGLLFRDGRDDARRRRDQYQHGGRPRIPARQILHRCQTKSHFAAETA